jgi:hypothetical protein
LFRDFGFAMEFSKIADSIKQAESIEYFKGALTQRKEKLQQITVRVDELMTHAVVKMFKKCKVDGQRQTWRFRERCRLTTMMPGRFRNHST